MIKDIIDTHLAHAYKAQASTDEKVKKSASILLKIIKEIKTTLSTYETKEPAKQEFGPYSSEVELKLVKKILKEHQDTKSYLSDSEQIAEEEYACDILKGYLPKEVDASVIEEFTHVLIKNRIHDVGSISMKDMKDILTGVKVEYPSADGKIVSAILKTYL